MPTAAHRVLVVGGGPGGFRAAEVAAATGAMVTLCEAQPSFGRKFLVAGRGGLNLTHGEPVENFPMRYGAEQERWRDLLAEFGPDDLRTWAAKLGSETFVGTSGRVFPEAKKAAGLLRAWIQRLRDAGIETRTGERLTGLRKDGDDWRCEFERSDEALVIVTRAVVLALGGGSWPDTGSDGAWPTMLAAHGVEITPWAAANCGWNADWPPELLARAEGLPLKNLMVTAGGEAISGELLITRYGLEGGAIYRLGPVLRAMSPPQVVLDLKPQLTPHAICERLLAINSGAHWSKLCKLSPAATALIETLFPNDCEDAERLARRIKTLPLRLVSPRPIAEAISSAGGVRWAELDEGLMLRRMPGVFVAGEMIDWEAPTGGYLLQGCFSTGTRAGRAAAGFARDGELTPPREAAL